MDLTFRPITESDSAFLTRVYASTREMELAAVPWTPQQKSEFLQQQFDAQHQYYMEQFKQARFQIILLDGEPVGRLYIDYRENEIRLIDIALLTEHRGKGLGKKLMKDILAEGQNRNAPVTIHVEKNNPAMRLYHRLGFEKLEDQGVYDLMEWRPK